MRYRDEKFYWTYQRGISWPDKIPWPRLNDPVDYRRIGEFH